ncbi:MAG: Na+/H+ antiporter NhaA, partial [Planctomycetota bacterium]
LIRGDLGTIATDPVTLGVFFGLVIGKPVGVVGFSFLAVKLGIAALPSGVTWRHIVGVGGLAGIGFTMALFIANLAFTDDLVHLDAAKTGILAGSIVSTVLGVSVLLTCRRSEPATP